MASESFRTTRSLGGLGPTLGRRREWHQREHRLCFSIVHASKRGGEHCGCSAQAIGFPITLFGIPVCAANLPAGRISTADALCREAGIKALVQVQAAPVCGRGLGPLVQDCGLSGAEGAFSSGQNYQLKGCKSRRRWVPIRHSK
jgi:hypothetical protein